MGYILYLLEVVEEGTIVVPLRNKDTKLGWTCLLVFDALDDNCHHKVGDVGNWVAFEVYTL